MEPSCTNWFDSLPWVSWKHCCDTHDYQYFILSDRLQADIALFKCVIDTAWYLLPMAIVMFVAVRLFGYFYYKV